MKHKAGIISVLTAAFLSLLVFSAGTAFCEDTFEIKRIGNIHPYADNAFRIRSNEAGTLEIRIHDGFCVYRTISREIPQGETMVHWDGCGYNREKLYEKTYTITADLTTQTGDVYSVSFDSPVEYALQCLQYALTSSDTLYLDSPESWFLEYRTVTDGKVVIEIRSKEHPNEVYSYSAPANGAKIIRKDFTAIAGRKEYPQAGSYLLCVYERSRPEEKYESDLIILDSAPDSVPVTVTGEILPDRSMSDAEIWEMMMKPSVVVDIDSFKHQNVYEKPDQDSRSLGTLHGQSQGLRVIAIEEGWAMIGAWNHEDASYVEGWIPLEKLKTVEPREEYGLLIDKQKQTLTVYQNGTVIDTLLVSTGRAEKNNLDQETAAGCFLTGYHRVNFSMNGKKYDYVIQYDGGNLLHQTPYDWGQHKKDFTLGRGYLGAKASHACIRIQPEPGEGGLNAYWLFTHIPYHTRVMILDDQAEREATAEKLKRTDKDSADIRKLNLTDTYTDSTDLNVEITFGGCVFPGGTKSFNARKESFASAVREKGYGFALNELAEIFRSDDFTCVNLCTAILNESAAAPDNKGILFAKSGTEHLFDDASVEMIQITEDRTIPSEGNLRNDTEEILRTFLQVLTSDRTVTCTLKGHLFGFAGCSESEYLKDPSIIDRSLAELEQAGCEKKIVLLSWPEENNPSHSVTQEAMAHRAVRSGADIVIGNSPGTVQGIDYIENVPVVYSLGDLLNGSTGVKPKNQQGMLVRALFGFENGHDDVTVRVIPIMPYGNGDSKQNEYTPSAGLSGQQTETLIGRIWKDSAEAALARVIFYMKDQ